MARGYPPEFRAEAIELVRAGGRSTRQIASDLGISYEALRQWVRQADLDDGKRSDGLTTDERSRLRQLERENRILREEREILKKPRPSSRSRRHPGAGSGLRVHPA